MITIDLNNSSKENQLEGYYDAFLALIAIVILLFAGLFNILICTYVLFLQKIKTDLDRYVIYLVSLIIFFFIILFLSQNNSNNLPNVFKKFYYLPLITCRILSNS